MPKINVSINLPRSLFNRGKHLRSLWQQNLKETLGAALLRGLRRQVVMAKNARKQRVVAARKKKQAAAQRTPKKRTPRKSGGEGSGKGRKNIKVLEKGSSSRKSRSEENTSPSTNGLLEPLVVHKLTRLPLKSLDRESQTVWYACRKCLRVFGTAKERDMHRQLHKKEKTTLKSPATPKTKSFKTPSKSTTTTPPPLVSARKSARKSTEALADVSSHSKSGPSETSISSNASSQDVSASSSSKHQTQGNELSCNVCNKQFSSRKDLKRHVAGHNSTQPEQAIHLGRKTLFGKASMLKGGESDDDDAPYDLIDESTTLNKFTLPPHTCKVCNKAFAQKRNLTGHMETHKDAGDRFSLTSPASVKTSLRRTTREGPRTAKGLFQSAIRQKNQDREVSPGPMSP